MTRIIEINMLPFGLYNAAAEMYCFRSRARTRPIHILRLCFDVDVTVNNGSKYK